MVIGLDVGSTTIKCVVLSDADQIVYQTYERHFSQITAKTVEMLRAVAERFPAEREWRLAIAGSAGMGMAEFAKVPFVQEVYAAKLAAERNAPGTDCIIELGGEDAKILFVSNGGMEARMNGTCAGGTGAFIDQMATLLDVDAADMDALAGQHERVYTIASRCGVFAKSDIQPLLNQGAKKSDIAASIFYAVVNQTIGGLAQGRPVKGNILYLGGPLTFMPMLRRCFDEVLGVTGTCPENSLYYVSLGAAYAAKERCDLPAVIETLKQYVSHSEWETLPPLFETEAEYEAFRARHAAADVPRGTLETLAGPAYLGIDAGSTTLKAVVTDESGALLHSAYLSNSGNPVPVIRDFLLDLYRRKPDLHIAAACVTGYGEDIIKNAFHVDYGLVETMAHFTAARRFMPEVEFIVDIGGQDMKCFHVQGGVVDNIYLNEACSSGCGSFLQTFANALHYDVETFSKLGLYAAGAVDLGSRCTVFMNSSVKQAQKDGATTGDISAGLSVSIVKNAIYKVIRPSSLEDLGQHIVVQGGTFLNDAVLRAFERELGTHVVRPAIAGLMGAYGCALHAQSMAAPGQRSTLLGREALEGFTHQVRSVTCGLCENHCRLTVNTFADGTKYIGGNRCERPVTKKAVSDELNIYRFKQEYMKRLAPVPGMREKRIGIPLGLNMWEMAPFWHAFFTELGFETIVSPQSSRTTFLKGQASIPSDTVCFPAKLLHGHVEELLDMGVDAIYYPCMSFNFDEHLGDNHYNCPVVAYYPETIAANMTMRGGTVLINDYVGPHVRHDFPEKMTETLQKYFGGIRLKDVRRAADQAYAARDAYLAAVRQKGAEIIDRARAEGKRILCLAGRPYHADPEINHGIDLLLTSLGLAVISEDCLSDREKKFPVHVLNQWTYHARLYAAAKYIGTQKDMELVQLISFGCGLDAITSDECRAIVERAGKIYTQIKIDEITNLGTVKVRLRSLLAALEQKER
ncbi:MAG: 2-hydroxyacyl-CoA dehydratase [Clostridiales bacterium]|nr:2-hydroxyacyl-CoA dehydratase [Clostridiales bacterium]